MHIAYRKFLTALNRVLSTFPFLISITASKILSNVVYNTNTFNDIAVIQLTDTNVFLLDITVYWLRGIKMANCIVSVKTMFNK